MVVPNHSRMCSVSVTMVVVVGRRGYSKPVRRLNGEVNSNHHKMTARCVRCSALQARK